METTTHPILSKVAKQNPGIYTPNYRNKNLQKESYTSIGDPFKDPHKRTKPSSRFGGKQMITNPPKNASGNVGHFDKFTYSSNNYEDKTTYKKSQPLADRKNGFGSRDASRRSEFTTTVRTEQYREQLRRETQNEALTVKEDLNGDGKIDALDQAIYDQKAFPKGLRECKHLYDIGRDLQTEFDPRSSRDTFYNDLECKSRSRDTEKRLGGYYLSSREVGAGTYGLDHSNQKPTHGHVRATKRFLDNSHLGIKDIC